MQQMNQQQRYQPAGFVQSFYNPQNVGKTSMQNQYNQFANRTQQFAQQSQFQQYRQQQFNQAQNYHLQNYRGNQAGHDNYLRADSTQPSQASYAGAAQNAFQFQPQYGQQQYAQQQFNQAQNYHLQNYRGNQPGHDNYLRADSTQPSQASFAGAQNAFQFQQY